MKADELPEFIGENGHFSTIFDFSAHCLSDGEHGWYDAPKMEFSKWRKAIFQSQMETQKYGFKANIIENHDEPRGVSRFLPAYAQTPAGTKMLGTVNLLLRGIPFIYQGQEIGMKNAKWNSIDEFDDISTKDQYQIAREAGLSDREAMEACNRMSRDNARTPMQWTSGENAGFTKGTAWLKTNPDYKEINVEDQENNPDSVLNYYRKLVALRKSDDFKAVFTYGEFIPEYEEMDDILAFYRKDAAKCILVAANFGTDVASIELKGDVKKVLLSNQKDETVDCTKNRLNLKSCEVVVLEMEME
jgi:oligo-1,6-glucosidase